MTDQATPNANANANDNVSSFAEAKEKQDKVPYTLFYPIESRGETLRDLSFRRPVLRDKYLAEKEEDDFYFIALHIIAAMAGVDIESIEKLDEETDVRNLIDIMSEMDESDNVAVAENEDGSLTFALCHPYEVTVKKNSKDEKKIITEMTMRRPRAGDTRKLQGKSMIYKVAHLCDCSIKELLGMDLKTDYLALEKGFNSFRKRATRK